jgi:CheY-like chemotaxis protein
MTATTLPGGSVFLVEDEVMIRMMVADMLEELGYSVAAEAGEINDAIRLAQCTEFDLAILDVNVNGKVISPVAELIQARNRPFIFATGYGSSGLPEEYRDRPALQKPFQLETLGRMIETALKSATVSFQISRACRRAIAGNVGSMIVVRPVPTPRCNLQFIFKQGTRSVLQA